MATGLYWLELAGVTLAKDTLRTERLLNGSSREV